MKVTFRSGTGDFFGFLLTLPVDFWRFSFDFGTQLHHLFCHPSAVVEAEMMLRMRFAHTHTRLVFWFSLCPEGIASVEVLQHMNITTVLHSTCNGSGCP